MNKKTIKKNIKKQDKKLNGIDIALMASKYPLYFILGFTALALILNYVKEGKKT